jgi:hypothetical protein
MQSRPRTEGEREHEAIAEALAEDLQAHKHGYPATVVHGKDALAAIQLAFSRAHAEIVPAGAALAAGAPPAARPALGTRTYLLAVSQTFLLNPFLFPANSFVRRLIEGTQTRQMSNIWARALTWAQEQQRTHPNVADGRLQNPPLLAVCAWERDWLGVTKVRKDRQSASHALLWLHRGTLFIQRFMEIIAMCEGEPESEAVSLPVERPSPHDAAIAAYGSTLRPFHGFVLSSVFRVALTFVPHDRSAMIHRFGWQSDDDACKDLRACLRQMKPVTLHVSEQLRELRLDFPDKVGSILKHY